jgi:hypothetical protein
MDWTKSLVVEMQTGEREEIEEELTEEDDYSTSDFNQE